VDSDKLDRSDVELSKWSFTFRWEAQSKRREYTTYSRLLDYLSLTMLRELNKRLGAELEKSEFGGLREVGVTIAD